MARPQKTGLDYFPVDVDIFSDIKMRIVMARFGADGFTFYMYLLTRIYRDGYCTAADEDFMLIASADLQMSIEKIGQMLSFFLERSLLDSKLFRADKILTSTGIQRRYQEAIKSRASKKAVTADGRYWLLKAEDTEPFIQVRHDEGFSGINPDKSEKNPGKSEIYHTKESKGKKSKEEESRGEEPHPAPPPSTKQDGLVKRYGQALVDAYIAKAQRYRKTGAQAVLCAAQWLAEDEAAGKFAKKAYRSAIPSGSSSLHLDDYEQRLESYIPVYRKETTDE